MEGLRENYYDFIGVIPDASTNEIVKACNRLLMRYHPDKCRAIYAGDISKYLNSIKEILTDPIKRREYDSGKLVSYHGVILKRPRIRSHMSTTLTKAVSCESWRTVVPANVVKKAGFQHGDQLNWNCELKNGEWSLVVNLAKKQNISNNRCESASCGGLDDWI